MEAFGSFLDEEWESLSKLFSSENSDLLPQFNGENLFPNQVDDQNLFFPSDAFDQTNFYCVSQESSNSSDIEGAPFANPVNENGVSFLHNLMTNTFESLDFCTGLMPPVFPNDHTMDEIVPLKANAEDGDFYKEMTCKRKYETPKIQTQDNDHSPDQSPKKKPRLSRDYKGQKNKTKKNKKGVQNDEEENTNGVGNGKSSSTCSYEEDDDSNCNGGATSESKGKAKTRRGLQLILKAFMQGGEEKESMRLRILQNLVPHGTKVDISTMLEEALHYVKFLRLQIKLLSSDELWIYAPIAYNGMDIGLYQKIDIPSL